jgi:glycosyltransferase involved in cell wall biosynthesis
MLPRPEPTEANVRAGFDARWYNDSGVGVYVAQLLRAMGASREVDLVVYEDPRNPVPGLDGLAMERVPVTAPKYSLAEQFAFYGQARRDKLDVFHSPFYVVPVAVGCPVIVTFHDLIPFLFRIYSAPKQWMVKAGYRWAAKHSTRIIAVSQNTAADTERILKTPREKITAILNAVSRDVFHPGDDEGELQALRREYGVGPPYAVVASARNWKTKNLGSATVALMKVWARTGIEFTILAYGPREGIDAERRERKDPPNLVEAGYVTAKQLAIIFRHAHVFVMPSLYEGFGLPLLEAMSCGCAVVTSNRGSLLEVAGPGAQTFDPLDVDGMARAIAQLFTNPAELAHWRARALERAQEFSWSRAAKATIGVYRQAIGGNR